jgi:hypothetical protein
MIEKRWVLIEPPTGCTGAIRVSGAGTASVNGIYCPEDGTPNVWTKEGGTIYEDSIYTESALGFWVITSGGLYSSAPTNVKYFNVSGPTDQNVGTQWGPSPAVWNGSDVDMTGGGVFPGGALPVPTVEFIAAEQDFDSPPDTWSVYQEVHPLNLAKFSEEPDLNIGLVGRRRKLNTDLVFTGTDYTFFLHYQRRRGSRCTPFYIRREWKCGGQWQTVWTGVFSVGAGEWDHDQCLFSVRPEPVDRYTCLLRALNEKVNLMRVEPVTATAVIVPSLELGVCVVTLNFPIGCEGFDQDEWTTGHSQIVPYTCAGGGTYQAGIFWREKQATECINGNPVPPLGAGWVLLENNCATTGYATYVRNSTIAWSFGDATVVESASTIADPPDDTCAWAYAGYISIPDDVDPFCTGPLYNHFWVCLNAGDTVEYGRARRVVDCANYLIDQAGCPDVSEVVSDFFEWSAPGDTPGYFATINYLTGELSQVNHLLLLQKSDAIDPNASNPATIGEMTMKEFLQMLRSAFQVYWLVDDQGRMRIEHWTAWHSEVGLDLTATGNLDENSLIEPMAYRATTEEAPRIERLTFAEAQGRDFVGSDIRYDSPCVGPDNTEEKVQAAGEVTTDLSYINADPDAIAKTGFVLLACRELDSGDYEVIIDNGAITGNFTSNAPLATANLQQAFWRHNRPLWEGRMNGTEQTFIGVAPNYQQSAVQARLCCELLRLKQGEVARTNLGVRYFASAAAIIAKLEVDEETDWTTLTLRYAT